MFLEYTFQLGQNRDLSGRSISFGVNKLKLYLPFCLKVPWPEIAKHAYVKFGQSILKCSFYCQKRSHRANEYITLVKDDLAKAVEQCIEAVGYEFDTDIQKMLIRAAQFGKCFVPNLSSDDYVKMCRLLRVLNAVRDPKIGIPLTFMQYPFHRCFLFKLFAVIFLNF